MSSRSDYIITLSDYFEGLDPQAIGDRYGLDPSVVADIQAGRIDRLPMSLLEPVMAAVVGVAGPLPTTD